MPLQAIETITVTEGSNPSIRLLRHLGALGSEIGAGVSQSIKGWDLRVVANHGGSYVGLVWLSPNRERMSFLPDHLKVLPVAEHWPTPAR